MLKGRQFFLCRRRNAQIYFLQETHSGENDVNLWKSQWGDLVYFSHGTQQSAGVAIMFNKLNADVLETEISDGGRWIILVLKVDNVKLIMCNVYGYNTVTQAEIMFKELCLKIKQLQSKYGETVLVFGGDFNDAPDDTIDRLPPRSRGNVRFKSTSFISDQLAVVDAWRFLNPQIFEFTWSNANRSLQSRIDLWFISPCSLQYVTEVNHSYAPLSDHKLITIQFNGKKQGKNLRGYWKLNNDLLNDTIFCDTVKRLSMDIFNNTEMNDLLQWEYFKFKVRECAIKRSKEIKKTNMLKESRLMDELNGLLSKQPLNEADNLRINQLQLEIDNIYLEMAKGAYIRSKSRWLEHGEKNSSYFFALEKRNRKKNSISCLKINENHISDPKVISDYVYKYYSNIYKSKNNIAECNAFINRI